MNFEVTTTKDAKIKASKGLNKHSIFADKS